MSDLLRAAGAPVAMPGEATPFGAVAPAIAAVCRKVTRALALLVSVMLLIGASAAVAQEAPTITAISPASGAVIGTNTITITGTGLDTTTAVTFGGNSASFAINGATSLTVTVPPASLASNANGDFPAPGAVDVAVTTPAGIATVPNGYTYLAIDRATITFPIDGSKIYSQHIIVTGTADPGNTLRLAVSDSNGDLVFGAGVTVDGNGAWHVALPALSDGNYSLLALPQTYNGGESPGSNIPAITVASGAPPAITIDPTTLADAVTDRSYRSDLTASGGTPPLGFAITAGALPTGLSLSPGGAIAGTPRVGGSFSFTVTATDIYSDGGPYSGSRNYTLTVAAPTVLLTPATLPDGAVTAAYSQTITASGATAPYAFSLSAGALPPGLALSAAGLLSGTATTAGHLQLHRRRQRQF
ncbi:Ig domain-containing protein [Sphingomonas sp. RT2P30]|uniref:Ig domain-containing protein n=1 Tax=Parasphingomonas halimpatiens TaxID=3096162 RepID=UPI002FC96511